ncbi:MAG: hypothetical protein HZA17_00430 [Nitrospirae bacterium]|nr:hypothetical protein [Nitrospirota bacterium]
MIHKHTYEAISHHGLSSKLMELGLQSAEVRKCAACGKEMTFILTKKNEWVPLFDDHEAEEEGILLA